ncbi:MAG: hypothetical protein KDI44_14255 [Thiothrix sp.]|nr:hypothetical protein [Thiothrix sp.]HPQ94964.1 hypothetical protein [Thiolinea sp.]
MATEKQRFVRDTSALFVAAHHAQPDAERAVKWAEALWKKLADMGYGDQQKPVKPRGLDKDWYAALDADQQRWFSAFWAAFAYKQGRNEAAQRWHELGKLAQADYQPIIKAAKLEAAKILPEGQSRKMAQGWLSERRWLDYDAALQAGADGKGDSARRAKSERIRELLGGLNHARQTLIQLPEQGEAAEYWRGEIDRFSKALAAANPEDCSGQLHSP